MAKRIQLRRDTKSNWERINPVLAQGEVAVDLTTKNIKIGNGVDAWDSVKYAINTGSIASINENTYIEIGEGADEGIIYIVNEGLETVTLSTGLMKVGINTLLDSGIESLDPFSGTLVVQGGVGITGNLNIGGEFRADRIIIEDEVVSDVTGNLTGNVFGDLIGDVYSSNGVKILENGTTGTNAVFTGSVTGNVTSTGTSTFSNIDVNGGAIDGAIIGANNPAAITGTTINGTTINATQFNGDFNGNLKGDVYAANGTSKILENGTNGSDAVFYGSVQGTATGGLIGDVYADNGTSKILENGTDGTNAIFTGNVTGNITSTGTSSFSNIDVNGGEIDNTEIGKTTARPIRGTDIYASNQFHGDLDGTVYGYLQGDVVASDGSSIVLDNGTDGTDALFTGDVNATVINTDTLNTTSDVAIGGNLTVAGTADFTGNISAPNLNYNGSTLALASTRFTVETTSGNTYIDGTLTVNGTSDFTGKLTAVDVDITGDLAITGDLSVDDIDATTLDTTGDVTVGGDLSVNGGDFKTNQTTFNLLNNTATTINFAGAATTIEIGAGSGTTNINHNLDVDLDLNVDGLSTFTGNMTAGNVSVTGNLEVTGQTTLNDPLDVNAASDFSDNVTISAAADFTIYNSAATPIIVFSVDGATGDTFVGGTLNVTGTSTFTGDMTAGNIDAGTLDTTGNVSIGGTLAVTGTSIFTGDMTAGNIDASTLDTTGDVSIGGNTTMTGTLAVTGTSTFTGDMTAGNIDASTLDTTGNVSIGSNLTVTGTTTLNDDLDVNAPSDFSGNVVLSNASDFEVKDSSGTSVFSIDGDTGNTSIVGTLNVTGTFTSSNFSVGTISTTGDVLIGGNLTVTGTTTLNDDLDVNAPSDFSSNVTLSDAADFTIKALPQVIGGVTQTPTMFSIDGSTGNISTAGTLDVALTSNFTGTITANDINADNVGVITLGSSGDVNVGGNLSVTGTSSFTGDMTAGNIDASTLDTTGNVSIGGDLEVNGGDITTNQTAFNLVNTTATTVNFAGSATTIEIGASTGTTNVNNDLDVDGDVNIDGGDLTVSTTTFNLVNTTATTVNFAGAATTVEIGASTGITNINNDLDVDGDINIDGGDLTVSTTTFNLVNTTATTVNFAGAATTVEIGASTGTTNVNNNLDVDGDVNIDGGDLTVSTTTFNLANTTATTVNFAGAATTVEIGASTGTTNVNNDLDVDGDALVNGSLTVDVNATVTGDLAVNGGDITTTSTTFNLVNTTATTVNFAGAATTIEIGASTGTTNVNNDLDVDGDINIDGGDLTVSTTTFNLVNTTATTVNFAGAATTIEIGASTGTTNVNNNLDVDGDINIDGGDLTVSTTTFNLVNTTATTVNFAGAATTVEIGASTGTTNINNDLQVDGTSDFNSDVTINSAADFIMKDAAGTPNTVFSVDGATGDTDIEGSLNVGGAIAFSGNLTAGNITASGNVLIQGTLDVYGVSTFHNNFEVIRANPGDPETITTLERTDVTEFNASGDAEINGDLTLNGNFTIQDLNAIPNVFFTIDKTNGNTLTEGTLTVESSTTLNDTLDVNATSDFSGNVNLSASSDFTIQNSAATPVTIFSVDGTTGNTVIEGTLSVTGTSTFTGDMTAGNVDTSTLDVSGPVTMSSTLDVTGTSTLATVDINAGNIDDTVIGLTTPADIYATDIEADNITINNEGILKLKGTVNPTYIGFKAPANFVQDTTYTLPGVKGLDGYVLSLNTDGDKLEWISPDLFGGGQVSVSADYGDDNFDGINKPVATIKRALQIASGLVYDVNGVPNDKRIIIAVASGDYVEDNPIIIPDNVSVVGAGLRACNIRPLNANKDMLRVRNGCYFTEITFRDYLDVDKKPYHTFNYAVSFDDPSDPETNRTGYINLPSKKPTITISPYIQNCSIISFLGGSGVLIDGNLVNTPNKPPTNIEAENPPFGSIPQQGKSMVANAFTMLSFGGTGWRVINDAYAQIVSCFQIFCSVGSYAQSGGYLSVTNSATNFGKYALRASGYSPNAFEFDRGIVVGTGDSGTQQTIKAIGFKSVPTQDYVIRFRNPVFKRASDLLIANKDELQVSIVGWVNAQIATNTGIWNGFTYDPLKCAEDVGYLVDALAYDILSGGNSKTLEAGYLYVESTDVGFTSQLAQHEASIQQLKLEVETLLTPLGVETVSNGLFDNILDIIATPTIVIASIESSNFGDITSNFKPSNPSDTVSFTPASVVDVGGNTFLITNHGITEGTKLVYISNGNTAILGLDNEQTYYARVLDADTFGLYLDDSLTTIVDIKGTRPVSETHAFLKNVREFFIDDILTTHTDYQILTLVPGVYEFIPGRAVYGDNNDIFAYVYSYDSTTRKLIVSIEEFVDPITQQPVKNYFNNSSVIDEDHTSPSQQTNIGFAADVDYRSDLYTSNFRISPTVTGGEITNEGNLPENQIWLHRPSIVNSSGHTWEYAGSGTDYNALPQNGGKTIPEYEQVSDLPGRVYSSGTNELGDFKVGDFIKAENKTGNVTFTNTVSIAELDTLKLRIGNIVIQEISADVGLGDNEMGGAKDSRLSTQKAIRDFLQFRLGKFIDKNLSTNSIPGSAVQLNSSGKINADLIPAVRNFLIYKGEGYLNRLTLIEDVPPKNILNGDLITETYSTVEITLDNPITGSNGDLVEQAVSGASGYLVGDVNNDNNIIVGSIDLTFTANFNTTNIISINGISTGAIPTVVGTTNTGQTGNFLLSEEIRTQFLILDPAGTYDFTGITTVTGAVNKGQGTVTQTKYGVINALNNLSLTPGDGYTPASGLAVTYEMVSLTNVTGTGTGAKADITVENGVVISVDMRRGGTGYAVGDILSADPADVGGTSNTDFSIPVSAVQNRLYVEIPVGLKFEAGNTTATNEYISDANASSQNITATDTTVTTFSAATDVNYGTSRITINAHTFDDGDPVTYAVVGAQGIGGLIGGEVYFVKSIDANTIELYTNYYLSNKISFTSSGLGNQTLTVKAITVRASISGHDIIFLANHGFSTGTPVKITGSSLPTGINADNNIFFLGSVTTNSFSLHLTRSSALTSVNGLTTTAYDLTDTGSGTITFTEQNVTVIGTVDTSSSNILNWSSISTTNIDASNVVTGVLNTSRLATTGIASSDTFLRGDSSWVEAVQNIKITNTDSPLSLTGSYNTVGGVDQFYNSVTLDIARVDSDPAFSGALDPYTNLGVAKFKKDQFTVGTGATSGQVYITPATSGGTIDAKTIDGKDLTYLLTSSNHSVQPVTKGGTDITGYTLGDTIYANGSTSLAKLAIGSANYIMTSTGSAPQWSTNITVNDLTVLGNISQSGSVSTLTAYDIRMSDNNIELGSVSAMTGKVGTINSVTASSSTVTMTAPSTTDGMIPGMTLTKTGGVGAFGTNAVVTQINSATQFTFKADNNNTLGSITFDVSGASDSTADQGGITIKASTGDNKTLRWVKNTPAWTSSDNFDLAAGKVYKIDTTTVLAYDGTLTGNQVLGKSLTSETGDIVTSGSYWTRTFALMGA
jgi:hypothetical protein